MIGDHFVAVSISGYHLIIFRRMDIIAAGVAAIRIFVGICNDFAVKLYESAGVVNVNDTISVCIHQILLHFGIGDIW